MKSDPDRYSRLLASDVVDLRTQNAELMAEIAVLRTIVREAYREMMNAQPHLAQSLNETDRRFVDAHIDQAMKTLEKADA